MRESLDHVDRALDSLSRTRWTHGSDASRLWNTVARRIERDRSRSFVTRHRSLVTGLVVLTLAGAGFAAAGGFALLASLFVTVEIDGEPVDTREVIVEENGVASYSFPLDPSTLSRDFTIGLREGEVHGVDVEGSATIDMTFSDDRADVEITLEPVPPTEDG